MVAGKSIQKTQQITTGNEIYYLVNARYRKRIFRTCTVKISKIYTHAQFIPSLSDYNRIR